MLDDDEVKALFVQYRATGDVSIRNRIVEDTLPNTTRVATYIARRSFREDDPDDVTQEATFIVIEAAETFDPELHASFKAYSGMALHRKLGRKVMARKLGLTEQSLRRFGMVLKERRRLEAAGLPHETDDVYDSLGFRDGVFRERLKTMLALFSDSKTGNTTRSAGGYDPVANLPAADRIGPAEASEAAKAKVARLLGRLTPAEADDVRRRYGLHGGRPMSLKACARLRGVTESAIQLSTQKALAAMRSVGHLADDEYAFRQSLKLPRPQKPTVPTVRERVNATLDDLAAAGKSLTLGQIAKKLGCSRKSVQRAITDRRCDASSAA